MSWKRVILSSSKIESGVRSSMTLNLDNSMSSETINAKIDMLPKHIPYNASITIQFADGTYTLGASLNIFNFYGPGTLIVQGNPSETTALHSTQAVILDFLAASVTGMYIQQNRCPVLFRFIRMKVNTSAVDRYAIWSQECESLTISSSYLQGNGAHGYCLFNIYSKAYVTTTYFDNWYGALLNYLYGVMYAVGNGTAVTSNTYKMITYGATFTGQESNAISSSYGDYYAQGAQGV